MYEPNQNNIAVSLVDLAEFVRDLPQDLGNRFAGCFSARAVSFGTNHAKPVFEFSGTYKNEKEDFRQFIRAINKAGGLIHKNPSGNWYEVQGEFENFVIQIFSHRENVCEKRVVGSEEVTREVPDPDYEQPPMVEVTETVEKVEWICEPLMDEKAS